MTLCEQEPLKASDVHAPGFGLAEGGGRSMWRR